MSNNPLRHVGQTARPEEAATPDSQSGDAGNPARQQNPSEARPQDPKARKAIPDLKPGEPPPESSAGS